MTSRPSGSTCHVDPPEGRFHKFRRCSAAERDRFCFLRPSGAGPARLEFHSNRPTIAGMSIVIRPLTADDTSAVLSLYRQAVLAVPTTIFSSSILREWASRSVEEFVRQNGSRTRYVAQIGTMIVGYTGFDQQRSVLTECYVLPSQQRARIGWRLAGHVIALANGAGLSRLDVLASANAEGFYASLGFSVLQQESLAMADGQQLPCVRMTRTLR